MKPQEIQRRVRDGLRCSRLATMSDDFYALCLECWIGNPAARPSFKDIQRTIVSLMARLGGATRDLSAELAK